MQSKDTLLDRLVQSRLWDGLSPDRLIPLIEAAELRIVEPGDVLFEQFHPATKFYLLDSGTAIQTMSTAARTEMVHAGTVDWPNAALGWSGFLSPRRYGSTMTARSSLRLLQWNHEQLAELFYADPVLSIRFFEGVLDSVRRQLNQLRERRVAGATALIDPPAEQPFDMRRPIVGRADSCLRRSAFFSIFDESTISALAAGAELDSFNPGSCIARQDQRIDGLMLIASGRCNVYFETGEGSDARLLPFRRLHDRRGIVAGLPLVGDPGFVAEAAVYAESHCWVYRLPASRLQSLVTKDPEFGRSFQQRLLARLAGLIDAMQVERVDGEAEPEVAAVANMVASSRARLPVTSELHKVPHLLSHPLTVANAFAVLNKVSDAGRYHERLLASRCNDLIANLAAENAFYQEIVRASERVISADESLSAEAVRMACDSDVDKAFSYLDCRVTGTENLPATGGNIFVLNHLACPEYYELPNLYHFSFDTALVSCIVWRHFGQSAVRVVRESPGAEFGHNLFYQRLGHITVPTVESELHDLSDQEFAARRRAAGERFSEQGRQTLDAGMNLVVCPEGRSQPAALSPARFHTGAFRLALETGAMIVPVALAGFHHRFKDGPLVATVAAPVHVGAVMKARGHATVRDFADSFRARFAKQVAAASRLAEAPASLSHPG